MTDTLHQAERIKARRKNGAIEIECLRRDNEGRYDTTRIQLAPADALKLSATIEGLVTDELEARIRRGIEREGTATKRGDFA